MCTYYHWYLTGLSKAGWCRHITSCTLLVYQRRGGVDILPVVPNVSIKGLVVWTTVYGCVHLKKPWNLSKIEGYCLQAPGGSQRP